MKRFDTDEFEYNKVFNGILPYPDDFFRDKNCIMVFSKEKFKCIIDYKEETENEYYEKFLNYDAYWLSNKGTIIRNDEHCKFIVSGSFYFIPDNT